MDNRRELTTEDVMFIGLRAGLLSHLCGCLVILVWVTSRTGNPLLVFGVAVEMVISVAVPLIAASGVAEFVEFLRPKFDLPIPLFTRAAVVLIECIVLGWIIIFLDGFILSRF